MVANHRGGGESSVVVTTLVFVKVDCRCMSEVTWDCVAVAEEECDRATWFWTR